MAKATTATTKQGRGSRSGRFIEVSVNLDREELAEFDALATAEGLSRSELLRELIRSWMRHRRARDADEWDDVLTRIRSRLPQDVTPDEIAADVAAACEEAREIVRARRR